MPVSNTDGSVLRGKAIKDVEVPVSLKQKSKNADDVEEETPNTNKALYAGDVNLNTVQKTLGTNWTLENAASISQWMYIGAYQIKLLEATIDSHRVRIRANAITGIILSTLTGTLSVTTLGISDPTHIYGTVTSIIFALFSFTVAIFTGYLKIYQIQERLEECIKTKQDWITFTSTITSELQLPMDLRRDALYLLIKHKDTYLDLIKRDVDIPKGIVSKVHRTMPQPNPRFPKQSANVACLSDVVLEVQNTVLAELLDKSATHRVDISGNTVDEEEGKEEETIQIGDVVKLNKTYIMTKTTGNIPNICNKANYLGLVMDKKDTQYSIYVSELSLEPDVVAEASAIELSLDNRIEAKYSVGDIVFAYHMVDEYRNTIRGFYNATIVDKKVNMNWGKVSGHTYSVRYHHDISKKYDNICEYRIRTIKPIAKLGDIMMKKDSILCFVVNIKLNEFNWIYTVIDEHGKLSKETSLKTPGELNDAFTLGSAVMYITIEGSPRRETWKEEDAAKTPEYEIVKGVIIKQKERGRCIIVKNDGDVMPVDKTLQALISDRTNIQNPKFKCGDSIEYRDYGVESILQQQRAVAKAENPFIWKNGKIEINYKLGGRHGITYGVRTNEGLITVPEILLRMKTVETNIVEVTVTPTA